MYCLERKTGDSWQALYTCPLRWPLERMLAVMDPTTHRIIDPAEG